MRLFVALLPPPAVLGELDAQLAALRALPGSDTLRWTPRGGWHLTLAFLGEVDGAVLPELEIRLARAAHRREPYALRLTGGGRFGDRVLWAGVQGDLPGLGRLAESVRAAARRAGAPPSEEHGFNPHLTLARSRGRDRTGADLRPMAERLAAFEGRPWTADAVSLVRSHPPTPGVPGAQPRYERLRTWPLGH